METQEFGSERINKRHINMPIPKGIKKEPQDPKELAAIEAWRAKARAHKKAEAAKIAAMPFHDATENPTLIMKIPKEVLEQREKNIDKE